MSNALAVRYHFASPALADTQFLVENVRVTEALNEPYSLELSFGLDAPDVDVTAMIGRDCVLEIERGENVRRVVGVVRHVQEGDDRGAISGRLIAVPALWMLGLRRNTRIFQEQTVPEILELVLNEALGPYSRSFSTELRAEYPRREYCVQYQETDLDFVHRLMEEEGISYAFDHEGERELLVLRDTNAAFPELASGAVLPYEPHSFEVTGAEPVNLLHRSHRTTTTSVVVADWDWTKVDMPLSAEQRSEDTAGRDRERYEHSEGRSLALWDYDQGLRVYREQDGAAQARIRQEAEVRDQVVCVGIGRAVCLAPGNVIEVAGHPIVGLDARYLVTRVEHVSRQLGEAIEGAGSGDAYYNRFECIPVETAYRPARVTPKPTIPGIQTAVVTGPAGEEIHTDEHGRIKVQFHWDREGSYDEHSSCWIRVQQPWAGAGWGFWYLPRIDMEVVVHFVDGDPDRPLVTGCVYNGSNLLPYPLPDEKTKSTIKSNSSPGGGGSNELRFEDKAGSEEIYAHAQKDYNEVVENDHDTLVHHDQTITVDNDQTQTVKNDQTETVRANQTMTVDGNRTVHVKTNFDETVDGTETRHVVGNVSETFDSNEKRAVGANLEETIGGNETRTVGGDQSETIRGSATLTVGGSSSHTITGSLTQNVTGGITTSTPGAINVTAVGGLQLTAAAGVTLDVAGGLQVAAPGGVVKVDSVFKWEGVKHLEVCGFASGYTYLKQSIVGVSYSATGMKLESTSATLNAPATEFETKTTALDMYVNDLRGGAIELLQSMGIWV